MANDVFFEASEQIIFLEKTQIRQGIATQMEGKEAESSQIYEHLSPIRNKIATAETSQYKNYF